MSFRCVFGIALLTASLSAAASPSLPADDPLAQLALDEPLVTRGEIALTVGDIRAELAALPAERAYAARQDPEALRSLLNGLFRKKAIARRARAEGVQDQELAKLGMQMAENDYLARFYLEWEVANAEMPDFSVLAREQYLANKEQFRVPERVKAGHILIKTDQRERAQALAIAEDIQARLEAGEDWSQLFREFNEDAGTVADGSLGWFHREAMVADFSDAAFALQKPGDRSGIVETEFGFHIIRLEDRKQSYLPAFEEVKDSLVARLRQAHMERVRRELVSSFDSREDVELNEDALRALRILVPRTGHRNNQE